MRTCACCLLLAAQVCLAQSDDLAAKAQRGKEAMAAGRFQEAISIYGALVRALPDNPGLILNLGLAEHMAGQDRQAIQHFEAALQRDPSLLPARLFLGMAHMRLGEPAAAIEPLSRVLQTQPDNQQVRQVLADALLAVGRFEQAAKHFEFLAKSEPQNPKAWYGLERSYEFLSRRAFADLEKAAPGSAYWLALAAGMRLAQQQYSPAFFLYRQALEKKPDLRGIHTTLAEIYRLTGHADWAATEEQKERQVPPPNCASEKLECEFGRSLYGEIAQSTLSETTPESYYWRSLAYNEMALQALSRLAQLPPSAELHELLAQAHRNQSRHQEAVKEWREALKLAPGDLRIERELAISLHQVRDYDSAQKLLESLLRQDPDSAELNYLLGDTLLGMQRAERGIPFLKKAVDRDPALLLARASLGRAYLQIGQAQAAIPHLRSALSLDEDGSLHYQLARAYQSAGQPEQARQMMQKYQEILRSAEADQKKLGQEIQIAPPE